MKLSISRGVSPVFSASRSRLRSASVTSSFLPPIFTIMSGSERSSGSMAATIASDTFMRFSASNSCSSVILPAMPGSIFSMPPMPPILRTLCAWNMKSLKSKSPFCIFLATRVASSEDTALCAFSSSVATSPMPRMREAIRSGKKGSRSSMPSPTPTNLIGLPDTPRTESAAPPRVSPSILVSTAPVMPIWSLKVAVSVAASWPVIASTTSSTSSGVMAALICRSSSISTASTTCLPAVSKMTVSYPSALAFSKALRQICTGFASCPSEYTSTPN
mmetsp:Transcript_28585/g.61604  ORF Transcript_28585/g.61604 Transcript_28585/m.61604 type:complete len:275 (-) Transcript_28585:685-1509(-)